MASILNKILIKAFPQSGDYSSDIEDSGRRRLFAIFLALLVLPLILFGAYLISRGYYGYGIVDYIIAFFFLLFLFIFRRARNSKNYYRLSLALLCFLMIYWVNTGAGKGYGSIWVMTIPPFAYFLLGKREGTIWTVFVFLVNASFFFIPALSVNGFIYDKDFISRYLFTLFLIVLFTYNYESVREKYKKAMESEQKNLLDEKERLAEAKNEVDAINSILNKEMKIRRNAEEELIHHKERLEEIVSERTIALKRMNEQLAASEARYRLMADNITDMIWTADLNLAFTFISPSVTRIFGYTVEEAMALSFDRWNTPESFRKVAQIYVEELELDKKGGEAPERYVVVQLEHRKKDGSVIPVEVTVSFLRNDKGEIMGIVGITRDISEKVKAAEENRRIQEQLAQAQKMEAIGTLVGGIAHDFNNILGGIIGSFDLLERLLRNESLGKRDKVDKYLKLGMESSLRSSELIKQLLALSRKHEISLSPVRINDSLSHVMDICRNSLPKSVEINYIACDNPMTIMGDSVQIEQVILNLCINGSHAMTIMRPEGEKHGGVLKVRCSEIDSDIVLDELCSEIAKSSASWVRIEVSDTGVGMDRDTVKRIYEPFFTMKRQDEGSGLGLAISYNIIRQHRGFISVSSEPGRGTLFTIYLPSYNESAGAISRRRGAGDIIRGSGIILVIDDEPVMLNIARGFLEECGYSVLTAAGGEEGIESYRSRYMEIDAVLVDLSMPGKSGLEVFMELQEISGEVKVLLASGMLDSDSFATAEKIGVSGVVHKPYLADELSCKIKSVIQK